jgi:hypothetical protein
MALVEAASFIDRNQAFIARAALLDAGIFAEVRDNAYANMMFGMAIATGGYPVLVAQEDLKAARALLEEAEPVDAEALDWTKHPKVWDGIPAAALGFGAVIATGAEASAILGLKRRRTLINLLIAALPIVILIVLVAIYVAPLRYWS